MEIITLLLFCAMLLGCVASGISILYALCGGLLLFFVYGLIKKVSAKALFSGALSGIRTVANMLIVFALIGMLTALWRACGTIPAIVSYSSGLLKPKIFLPMVFLLNCLVSVLTGTAFGTAATMGVICASLSATMGIPPVLCGGAVLSGAFFGDRISPVSTSALLVSQVSDTNIYDNIRRMFTSCIVPFILSCILYTLIGFGFSTLDASGGLIEALNKSFEPTVAAVIPAIIMLLLSLFRLNVKITMSASILSSVLLAFFSRGLSAASILKVMLFGYHSTDAALSGMLDGGGILSMANVAAIILISSMYTGLFRETGLTDGVKKFAENIAKKTTAFTGVFVCAVITAVVSCNQALCIMLTCRFCEGFVSDKAYLASALENTCVTIAPLIPWSIACAVPLSSIGAPFGAVFFAFFLYLNPLWNLAASFVKKK